MKKTLFLIIAGLFFSSILHASTEVHDRVVRAALALRDISHAPDHGIPRDLLDQSVCVAVIPGMKRAGFIFGGNFGKGVMSCRINNGQGPWSAPSMLLVEGGSFGLQIGVQSVDLILVILNLAGKESLLDSKFTLGGDFSVAAGPVGRSTTVATDAFLSAKILTYSRSRGLYGGLVLKGGTIRPDRNANHVLYNKALDPRNILFYQTDPVPKDVQIFLDTLTELSPIRKTE
ncbi:MAG TPA: lipid-binding SYLF domain-containing protein [Acidobacteriota bacterium]|nr:lipid-binding SYLF domain-containing protein [Acidobacteriota bacterium]